MLLEYTGTLVKVNGFSKCIVTLKLAQIMKRKENSKLLSFIRKLVENKKTTAQKDKRPV